MYLHQTILCQIPWLQFRDESIQGSALGLEGCHQSRAVLAQAI